MSPRPFIPLLIACAFALAACGKPENPEDTPVTTDQTVTLQLNLSFEGAMPETQYTKAGEVKVRHTLRFYRSNGAGGWASTPELEQVVTAEKAGGIDLDVKLKADRYKVLAWTDYVQSGSADWMWITRDFSGIRLPDGAYEGGSAYREAFFGTLEKDLGSGGAIASGNIRMTRPLAAYSLYATDAEAFDGKDITAVISYPDAVPSRFNLWEQAATDTREGLSFSFPVAVQADGSVLLGQDMVLVGGDSAMLKAEIRLQDASGTVLNRISLGINLQKGRRSVYKGAFLSEDSTSGIVNDPSFDGQYDINF